MLQSWENLSSQLCVRTLLSCNQCHELCFFPSHWDSAAQREGIRLAHRVKETSHGCCFAVSLIPYSASCDLTALLPDNTEQLLLLCYTKAGAGAPVVPGQHRAGMAAAWLLSSAAALCCPVGAWESEGSHLPSIPQCQSRQCNTHTEGMFLNGTAVTQRGCRLPSCCGSSQPVPVVMLFAVPSFRSQMDFLLVIAHSKVDIAGTVSD